MDSIKINRFNKIFPWFSGLSSDLLFWVAIDTLFLTVVKNLNASQIVSLTTISLITCILLQVPLLNIIHKRQKKVADIYANTGVSTVTDINCWSQALVSTKIPINVIDYRWMGN